jgi:predicted phage terminase large subunit-like protein
MSLSYFIKQAWSIIEPGQPYIHGWHIDFICNHLEAITRGEVLEDGTPYNRLLVNVPPGPGWVENLVMTDRGRIRLGDIRPEDRVLTHTGSFQRVSACYSKGMLPTLRIKTRSGREMVLTPDHNVLTPDGWVEARHLRVGSALGVVTPKRGIASDRIGPEEARLLGYLIGDGSFTQATVSFTNHDEDVVLDFMGCCAALGLGVTRGNRGIVRVRGGKAVHDWLQGHGLNHCSSYEKLIPDAVLGSSNEIIRHFIGAYWSCDGMIEVRNTRSRGSRYRASATTVSRRLADDLMHALTRVGIHSCLREKERALVTAAQPGGVYRSFNVEVYSEADTARFIDMPGLCQRKNEIAKRCEDRRFDHTLMEDPVVLIEDGGLRECMCISVDNDHSLTWSDIAVHNTMKSLLIGVFWPAWEWGPQNMPHMRYVCASHSQELAVRDGLRMRRLVQSEWYQNNWGDRVKLTGDQNQKIKFENTATGFRQAAAAGSITGSRGDRVIIDDPLSVDDAGSDAVRGTTNTWFLEAVPTRLNNPKTSAIIVIMQRLHEEDVSGIILDKQLGYDHIMLPMRYDPSRAMPTALGYEDPREIDGELLFPQRFPVEVVDRDEKAMGPYATAGQFQQTPEPRGGGIIKREWWQLWEHDVFPPMDYIIASLDTAYTEKTENDMSALTIWGIFSNDMIAKPTKMVSRNGTLYEAAINEGRAYAEQHPKLVLISSWAVRLPLHELVSKVAATCKAMRVDLLLIEAKASGISVSQELRRLYGNEDWGVQMINPGAQDKMARLYSVQHLFAEGMIYAPDRAWADQVITQCAQFPRAKHDDLVDTVSQALRHLRTTGMLTRSAEHLQRIEDNSRTKPNIRPLYDV